jgi:hypothetical protein
VTTELHEIMSTAKKLSFNLKSVHINTFFCHNLRYASENRGISAHNFVGSREKVPTTHAAARIRTVSQESTACQRKSKATVPCGAKTGRKAKERGKEPLTQLSDALCSSPSPKIGLGEQIGRTISGFLVGLYKVHPNMIIRCGYSLHPMKKSLESASPSHFSLFDPRTRNVRLVQIVSRCFLIGENPERSSRSLWLKKLHCLCTDGSKP